MSRQLTNAEIDQIVLKCWPIEKAMQGERPTYDHLRQMVRLAVEMINKKLGILPQNHD